MNYILVFGQTGHNILFVEKNRPAWQAGRFNLCGGKIEDGELPEVAAVRELKEEAGLVATSATVMGVIQGDWGKIYCVHCDIETCDINPGPGETERVFWSSWNDIKDDPRLMPNLRVVVPLLMTGTTGWVIEDSGVSTKESHTFSVTVRNWR